MMFMESGSFITSINTRPAMSEAKFGRHATFFHRSDQASTKRLTSYAWFSKPCTKHTDNVWTRMPGPFVAWPDCNNSTPSEPLPACVGLQCQHAGYFTAPPSRFSLWQQVCRVWRIKPSIQPHTHHGLIVQHH